MANEQDYIKLGKAQDDISSVTNTINDKKLSTTLTTHNGTEIKSTELELPTGDTVTKVSGSVSVDDKLTITLATDKGDKTSDPITLPVSKQYAKMKFSGEEATTSALPLNKIVVGTDEWKIDTHRKLSIKHIYMEQNNPGGPPSLYYFDFITSKPESLADKSIPKGGAPETNEQRRTVYKWMAANTDRMINGYKCSANDSMNNISNVFTIIAPHSGTAENLELGSQGNKAVVLLSDDAGVNITISTIEI